MTDKETQLPERGSGPDKAALAVVPRLAAAHRYVAGAILPTEDGRYLWQLRDDKPGIFIPGHFGLFGGGIDEGERPDQAIRRELLEELGGALDWRQRPVRRFTESVHVFPAPLSQIHHIVFFEVPILAAEVQLMVLGEGAAMVLMGPAEFMTLPHVAPWDLAAVLMHARGESLFGG